MNDSNYFVILSYRGQATSINPKAPRARLFEVEAITPKHSEIVVGSIVTLEKVETHGYFATPANMEAYNAITSEQADLRTSYRTKHL